MQNTKKKTTIEISIVTVFIMKTSKNILLLFSLSFWTKATSLCPYIATPNEPNKTKYVVIESVKL